MSEWRWIGVGGAVNKIVLKQEPYALLIKETMSGILVRHSRPQLAGKISPGVDLKCMVYYMCERGFLIIILAQF